MNNFNPNEFYFENEYFSFDATAFPYIYIKFKPQVAEREQFDGYIHCMNKILLQEKFYVILIELADSEYLKAEFRKELAEWNVKYIAHMGKFCKGVAHISHSEEQRVMMKTILNSYVSPYPVVVTDTQEKAENWLAGRV